MTIPVADRDDRRTNLVRALAQYMDVRNDGGETVGIRQDVLAILKFMGPAKPPLYDSIQLFWNMYQPRVMSRSIAEDEPTSVPILNTEDIKRTVHRQMYPPAPASSAELDKLLLECLDWVYDKFQVPYEPDSDSAEKLLDLVIELHIAAARAFKLKQIETDLMSEEWVSRLRAIERTMQRISAIASLNFGNPSFAVSTNAIWGMTQLELSRVNKAEGSYSDAIHYLDRASTSYIWALDEIEHVRSSDRPQGKPWADLLDWTDESVKRQEDHVRRDLRSRLTPLEISLKEAESLFNLLKYSPPSDTNWKQIAEDCLGLSILPELEWEVFTGVEDEEIIEDEEMEMSLSWSEFWHSTRAWATAQLSPSELVKTLELERASAAKDRLKRYFFDDLWSDLPERARGRLINADLIWNSPQRVSRESVLNDLLRAAEEMCEYFIVQPLVNDSTDILSIEAKMAERRRSLGVRDYINICELQSMPSLLSDCNLTDDEISFLTENLPSSMRQLSDARNPAEHETGTSLIPPALVDSAYRLFLGIGRKGVLPELARIGRKLQGRRR